jgi:hypothetical protein
MRWHAHMRRPGADERAAALPSSNGNGGDGNGTAHDDERSPHATDSTN